MRYYMYLDKPLLRSLYATNTDLSFNIDVIESSIRRSYTNNNSFSVDPSMENECNLDEMLSKEKDKASTRKSSGSSDKLKLGYGKGVSFNIETEKKYINISDVTEIKNIGFYHRLISSIHEDEFSRNTSRIVREEGKVVLYPESNNRNNSQFGENNDFFKINNICVLYNKKIFEGNLNLLSSIMCDVKVIGYQISSFESGTKLIKAIAIFLD